MLVRRGAELGEGMAIVQSLGLALFVYTVGIGAGAAFFNQLRMQLPLLDNGGRVFDHWRGRNARFGMGTGRAKSSRDGSVYGGTHGRPRP